MEKENLTLLSVTGKIAKWAIVSMLAGALLTFCGFSLIRFLMPGILSDYTFNLSGLIPSWIILSVIVGTPPHFKTKIYDPELGCFGSLMVQLISSAIMGVLILGLALLITLLADKPTMNFLLANWLPAIVGFGLYTFCLEICDAIWRKLMAVLP